jgi:L-cystine transport system substrate-binding protein
MKKKSLAIVTAAVLGMAAFATGCGSAEQTSQSTTQSSTASSASADSQEAKNTSQTDGEVITVKAARVFASPPYNYNDDDGNQTGFETEVIKAVFDLLPQYDLELIDTTDEDLLTGIQTGKYDFGFKTAWYTAERAETFIIPKENSAATTVGLLFRSENADQIKDLKTFSEFSGKLVPLAPSNAQYSIVAEWNEENPDYPIDLQAAESFDTSEAITWLLEGRYDGHIYTGHYYKNNIVSEDGAYHQFNDQLSWVIYKAIATYPMFNKEKQEIADAYDEAMAQLKDDGTIYDLEMEFFGEDIYQYLDDLSAQQ